MPIWEWPCRADEVVRGDVEYIISILFEYMLDSRWLAAPSRLPLNLHLGLLPFNRGRIPHVWPLVDGSPAGVSLHVMDDQVDQGGVVLQSPLPVYPSDTAQDSYLRHEAAAFTLFERYWPDRASLPPVEQEPGGTLHRPADLSVLALTAQDMFTLRKLRALTDHGSAAEYTEDGVRYRARISVEEVPTA